MKKLIYTLLCALCISSCVSSTQEDERPNILFILTDDMGYSDIGFNQTEDSPVKDIVTPNIDALANEGTIFQSAYACHMFCGPSRTGLMTGRYPHKIGGQYNLASFSEYGVDTNEVYISKVLHDAGYYTSIIGKWHLGEKDEYHPNNRGFDHFYGFLGGGHEYFSNTWKTVEQTKELFKNDKVGSYNEYMLALMRNFELQENPAETRYITDMFTEEGIEVINHAKEEGKPFFLFMSYNAPHSPVTAKPEDIATLQAAPYNITFKDGERAKYCAMMYDFDKQVQTIVDQLKTNKQYDNTLIVFMSDNGGRLDHIGNANNHPLSGGKGNIEEGGMRVPMFMHWPAGMKSAPKKYTHVVSGLDLYPTFMNMAKATLPQGKIIDGKDILPYVLENKNARENEILFHSGVNAYEGINTLQARLGKYKARTNGDGQWLLFDLEADISEQSPISNDSILNLLTKAAHTWALTTIKPIWFDNPSWGLEQKWEEKNMPNWDITFPKE